MGESSFSNEQDSGDSGSEGLTSLFKKKKSSLNYDRALGRGRKKKKYDKNFLKTSCFLTKFLYTNEINKIGIKNKIFENFFFGSLPC